MQVYVIRYLDSFEYEKTTEVIEINEDLLKGKVLNAITAILAEYPTGEDPEIFDHSLIERNGNKVEKFAEGSYTYDDFDGCIDVTLHEVQR